eukprot:360633-Chlamydomonas_euryale.AAC.21
MASKSVGSPREAAAPRQTGGRPPNHGKAASTPARPGWKHHVSAKGVWNWAKFCRTGHGNEREGRLLGSTSLRKERLGRGAWGQRLRLRLNPKPCTCRKPFGPLVHEYKLPVHSHSHSYSHSHSALSQCRALLISQMCRALLLSQRCRALILSQRCRALILSQMCRALILSQRCRALIQAGSHKGVNKGAAVMHCWRLASRDRLSTPQECAWMTG